MTQQSETKIVHIAGHGDFEVRDTQFIGSACARCHFARSVTGGCMHPQADTGSTAEVCGGMTGYLVKVQTNGYPDNDSQLGAGNG